MLSELCSFPEHLPHGPDGIPYGAWRAMTDLGIDVLFSASIDLSNDDGTQLLEEAYNDEPGCYFNLGHLACIPISPSGTTDSRGGVL